MHRVLAVVGIAASAIGYSVLTDLAIEKRVVSTYFGNIAFAIPGLKYRMPGNRLNSEIDPACEQGVKKQAGDV